MQKLWKRLFGLAALGSAVAGVFYYFKKTKDADHDNDDDDAYVEDFDDVFENEDFDLDNDLKPVSDRGYVPLTPKTTPSEDSVLEAVKDDSEDTLKDVAKSNFSQTTED